MDETIHHHGCIHRCSAIFASHRQRQGRRDQQQGRMDRGTYVRGSEGHGWTLRCNTGRQSSQPILGFH